MPQPRRGTLAGQFFSHKSFPAGDLRMVLDPTLPSYEPRITTHMSFDDLLTDRITLIKRSGERVADVPASVQKNRIYINDASLVIESGDLLERVASNGLRETYEVVHSGFYEKFHSIEAHYQITVRPVINAPAPIRPPIEKKEEAPARRFHPWRAVKDWWRGRWVDSTLESIFHGYGEAASPNGHYERPWLARVWLGFAAYWGKHWQFTITTLIAIGAIVVSAYVAIKYGK
jgi:hypothetical protein